MTLWRCRRYQRWLVDHADGVLDATRRARLERHLAQCAACRADLEALHSLPPELQTSTVPDPGEAFWQQQRQAIGRTIRNLPVPRPGRHLEWLREALQLSPWRYAVAATAALLLALSVYRIAERPFDSDSTFIALQLANLDTEALVTLSDLAETVAPAEDSLIYNPPDDEVAIAALAVGDLVGTHSLALVPDEAELSDTDLEGVDDLLGNVG